MNKIFKSLENFLLFESFESLKWVADSSIFSTEIKTVYQLNDLVLDFFGVVFNLTSFSRREGRVSVKNFPFTFNLNYKAIFHLNLPN